MWHNQIVPAGNLAVTPGDHFRPDDTAGKIAIVASFVIMILSNVAFSAGTAIISLRNPTYITPDGTTFVIWGVIYLLQLVLTVAQWIDPVADWLLGGGVRFRVAAAFILNALWLPLFTNGQFALALIIIILYLVALVSVYVVLNPKITRNMWHTLLYVAPLSANASWLVVATSANFFIAAGNAGWTGEYGVAGTPTAALLVVFLAVALALFLAIALWDFVWPLVLAWALQGIYRMQTISSDSFPPSAMNEKLATGASVGCVLALLAAYVGLMLGAWQLYQEQAAACGPPVAVPMVGPLGPPGLPQKTPSNFAMVPMA